MNKVYACTDLHGQYDLWKKISNYCDKTDTIYFLGDAIDRGKNGDKILIELLNDPRVIYLRGNHEQLMIDSAPYLFGEEADDIDFYTWIYNEGKDTYENLFLNKPIDYTKKIIADLKKLPTFASYINKKNQKILLSHAGHDHNAIVNVQWNRDHLATSYWKGEDNTIIVHGHTPVQHLCRRHLGSIYSAKGNKLTSSIEEVAYYCENHKIDLDVASWHTRKIALLDLDTLQPIYFYSLTK